MSYACNRASTTVGAIRASNEGHLFYQMEPVYAKNDLRPAQLSMRGKRAAMAKSFD